jgi:hypothetical protein
MPSMQETPVICVSHIGPGIVYFTQNKDDCQDSSLNSFIQMVDKEGNLIMK